MTCVPGQAALCPKTSSWDINRLLPDITKALSTLRNMQHISAGSYLARSPKKQQRSLQHVANRIGRKGLSKQALSLIKRGRMRIPAARLRELTKAYRLAMGISWRCKRAPPATFSFGRGQRLQVAEELVRNLKATVHEYRIQKIVFTCVPKSAAERLVTSVAKRVFHVSPVRGLRLPRPVSGDECEYLLPLVRRRK